MKNNQYISIEIADLFRTLLTKWWIFLICITILSGIAAYISINIDDEYIAQSTLFIGKESGVIDSITLSTISLNNQLISDYIGIIKSRSVSQQVINELNMGMSVAQFQSRVSVAGVVGSRMFTVSFFHNDPNLAADVVNKINQVIILKAEEIIGVKNIQVIDEAIVPKVPFTPNRRRNVAIAGAIGAIIGFLIIFLVEFFDQTFKKQEDVEKILGLNILGTIPVFKGEKRKL